MCIIMFWVLNVNIWVGVDGVLYRPALTSTHLNNKLVIAVCTLCNFQTSFGFSVLDGSTLEVKHIKSISFSRKTVCFSKWNIHLFKIPQHVELLLLGYFALVQSRVCCSARVHQAAVAVVLMRFDSTNIELSTGAIVTTLQPKTTDYQQTNWITLHAASLWTYCTWGP